jgi:adenylate kinase
LNNSPKSVYIFVGPPGSGKGTLSQLCVRKFGWVQLSTGNLCRKHIAEQTEIGKQIDFALKSGKLVSDSLINAMVHEWVVSTIEHTDSIILDGYPRTIPQAESLDAFFKQQLPHVLVHVIQLSISDELVVSRICDRLICQNKDCQQVYSLKASGQSSIEDLKCAVCSSILGRRSDDEVTAIKDRLKIYHKHAQGLLNFYDQTLFKTKKLVAEKNIDEVFEDFKNLLGLSVI